MRRHAHSPGLVHGLARLGICAEPRQQQTASEKLQAQATRQVAQSQYNSSWTRVERALIPPAGRVGAVGGSGHAPRMEHPFVRMNRLNVSFVVPGVS